MREARRFIEGPGRWRAPGGRGGRGSGLYAAGFGIFEQGTKAMGMAGAFTAQADDPSALFHNAGGLAFVDQAGAPAASPRSRAPRPSSRAPTLPGRRLRGGAEEALRVPAARLLVQPISGTWKFGLGHHAPFGLTTEWENPDQFAGRFLSTKAALRAFDVNPTIGWQIDADLRHRHRRHRPRLGRRAQPQRRARSTPSPSRSPTSARLNLQADFSEGYGFNVGILHKFNHSFSWGLSYRSKIYGRLRGRRPADPGARPATPSSTPCCAPACPSTATCRWRPRSSSPTWRASAWPSPSPPTCWSRRTPTGPAGAASTRCRSTSPAAPPTRCPTQTCPEDWEDAYNYRVGLRWTTEPRTQWRFGYVYRRDAAARGGRLAAAARRQPQRLHHRLWLDRQLKADFALMYLDFEERSARPELHRREGRSSAPTTRRRAARPHARLI